jgi:hypothetical protein
MGWVGESLQMTPADLAHLLLLLLHLLPLLRGTADLPVKWLALQRNDKAEARNVLPGSCVAWGSTAAVQRT